MGFFDRMLGRQPCPTCGKPIGMVFGSFGGVCVHCDSYVYKEKGKVVLVAPGAIADKPHFAVPLPWPDVRAVQTADVMPLSVVTAVSDVLTTGNKGVRRLEAKWPRVCCVCGVQSVRTGTIGRQLKIPRTNGLISSGEDKISIVADEVPYCAKHENGAAFDHVNCASPTGYSIFGLLFRSLDFRNRFRQANPCPWPHY